MFRVSFLANLNHVVVFPDLKNYTVNTVSLYLMEMMVEFKTQVVIYPFNMLAKHCMYLLQLFETKTKNKKKEITSFRMKRICHN